MSYNTEHIRRQLKGAREAVRMSQRELSARSGQTQSHISQIERGKMEPGLGSVVEVARALDLEIVLVPKRLMPAIGSLLEEAAPSKGSPSLEQVRLVNFFERWLRQNWDAFATLSKREALRNSLGIMRHLPLRESDLDSLRDAVEELGKLKSEQLSDQQLQEKLRFIQLPCSVRTRLKMVGKQTNL